VQVSRDSKKTIQSRTSDEVEMHFLASLFIKQFFAHALMNAFSHNAFD